MRSRSAGRSRSRSPSARTRRWPWPTRPGASGLPFGMLRHYADTDLDRARPRLTRRTFPAPSPATRSLAIPALNPDVTILHAQQRRPRRATSSSAASSGQQREAALAARTLLVTVEEQVERLAGADERDRAAALDGEAVSVVPGGAYPSYAAGLLRSATIASTSRGTTSRASASRFERWMRQLRAGHAAITPQLLQAPGDRRMSAAAAYTRR